MEWLLPWNWHINESLLAGMCGGGVLGLCRYLVTLYVVTNSHPAEPHHKRLLASHAVAAGIFSVIGAVVAWSLSGRAGDFVTGLTSIVLITVIAGKLMPSDAEAVMNAPMGGSNE